MEAHHIAAAFWPSIHHDDVQIASYLFKRSRHVRLRDQAKGPIADPATCLSYLKKDLDHVLAVAGHPGADPAVLDAYFADSRVSVRQALIANPATPYSTCVKLARWAADRSDDTVADALARISLPDVIGILAGQPQSTMRRLDNDALVARVAAEPAHAVALAAVAGSALAVRLAFAAHIGQLAGVTLSDIVTAASSHLETILDYVNRQRTRLSVEYAQLWLAKGLADETAVANGTRIIGRNARYKSAFQTGDPFDTVEPGAAELLLTGPPAQVHVGLRNAADENAMVDAIADFDVDRLTAAVDVMKYRTLPAAAETAIARRYVELADNHHGHDYVLRLADRFLITCQSALTDDDLVAVLAHGDKDTIVSWVSHAGAAGPRAGLMRRLASDRRTRRPWSDTDSNNGLRIAAFDAAGRKPELAGDIAAIWDEFLGANLSRTQCARAVYPVIRQRFADLDQIAAWELLCTLAVDWSGTLSALLDAVAELAGPADQASRNVVAAEQADTTDPAFAGPQQLQLL